MAKKLLMLKGLPASGKSTYAKELVKEQGFVRVNKDDLRAMLHGSKHTKGNEAQTLRIRDAVIADSLHNGRNVVVDDTNLNPIHEQVLRELAAQFNAQFAFKFFDVSVAECIERDLRRPVSVGARVIKQQYNQWLRKNVAAPVFDPTLPTAILCDIDGTLANMGARSPFDWQKVGIDTIKPATRDILVRYANTIVSDYHGELRVGLPSAGQHPDEVAVILMSGRDAVCRQATRDWLKLHQVPYDALHMRAENDNRKDNIVKRELYEQHIAGKYNVLFVLDDRDQVVDMWRNELGLTVMQVAEGDF
jgi:predicted kinase